MRPEDWDSVQRIWRCNITLSPRPGKAEAIHKKPATANALSVP